MRFPALLAHALSGGRALFEFDVFGTARTLLQSTFERFLDAALSGDAQSRTTATRA